MKVRIQVTKNLRVVVKDRADSHVEDWTFIFTKGPVSAIMCLQKKVFTLFRYSTYKTIHIAPIREPIETFDDHLLEYVRDGIKSYLDEIERGERKKEASKRFDTLMKEKYDGLIIGNEFKT